MKMFCVVYDSYFDSSIADVFKQAGITTYMKFHDTTGKDVPSQAMVATLRLGGESKVFALFMPVRDEEIPNLLQIARELKEKYPTVGLAAFTFPLEELVL